VTQPGAAPTAEQPAPEAGKELAISYGTKRLLKGFDLPEDESGALMDPELLEARTREAVTLLIGFGIPSGQIATLLRLPDDQFQADYAHEITNGGLEMEAHLGMRAMDIALNSRDHGASLRALFKLLEMKRGWVNPNAGREKGGNPMNINAKNVVIMVPGQLPPEEWQGAADKIRQGITLDIKPENVVTKDLTKK
jgi:hypothetical protein